jgi:CRP-like cAMP-binding protein
MTAHDVFEFLNPKQLDIISGQSNKVRMEAGEFVYHMGEPADHLFTVLEGL